MSKFLYKLKNSDYDQKICNVCVSKFIEYPEKSDSVERYYHTGVEECSYCASKVHSPKKDKANTK